MVKGKTEITGSWPQLSAVAILFLKKKLDTFLKRI